VAIKEEFRSYRREWPARQPTRDSELQLSQGAALSLIALVSAALWTALWCLISSAIGWFAS
jgi:hypothetical protein